MKRSTLLSCIVFLSVLGLADAWYLADTALTGGSLACSMEGLSGCNAVAKSAYSHLFGVPLGVYGLAFYGVFLIAALFAMRRVSQGMDRMLMLLGIVGLLASVAFVYVQLALIKAVCIYCLGSAGISVLLAGAAFLVVRSARAEVSLAGS